ncbi:MAG: 3-deoxy-manno-octulosonate cytidylyltransferase [Endomicrobium sp.]|jgi:3-deoxy-manno-octulosonate cytidylyltransferase (CMP-KDO synthetase)|nr:3-deoxy-manno-octulosonate cytidylyltransferase [Endomicrobium sp.]
MKIAVIIPSRYGSSRFPGKSLILIKGKPVVQYVLEKIKMCKNIDFFAVATDDQRIYNVVKNLGFNAFMTLKNCKTGTDRIAFVAKKFLKDYNIFINVQCDEFLLNSKSVDRLAISFKNDKHLEYATLACHINKQSAIKNPNIVKVVFDKNKYALYFSRFAIPYNRDIKKIKHYKHIGIYGYQRKVLLKFSRIRMSSLEIAENLEQLRALENKIKIKIIVVRDNSLSIDVPEDVLKVEEIC